MRLDQCHNIDELRARARRALPAAMFHYMDGGADDEWTLRRNSRAFDDYGLIPRHLRDVSQCDLRTRVLGCDLSMPLMLSPTGMSRLFHHDKEPAVARAAAALSTLYTLSTLATTSIEEIGGSTAGAKMFQIYIFKDRELTAELVQRCAQAGFGALCLTIDTPLAGNRERDRRHGMMMPPRFTARTLLDYAMHPAWALRSALNPDFRLANVAHRIDALGSGSMALIDYVNSQFDRSVTWDDAAWLAAQWRGPFVIKGVSCADDAMRAVSIGATALMLSNHGGRQLDGCAAPIDMLRAIREAVGNDIELIVDGGVRRGTHVLKALALGANACAIGRPYLYGLAAGGEAGVMRALTLLRDEIARGLSLLGCQRIGEVGPQHVASLRAGGA